MTVFRWSCHQNVLRSFLCPETAGAWWSHCWDNHGLPSSKAFWLPPSCCPNVEKSIFLGCVGFTGPSVGWGLVTEPLPLPQPPVHTLMWAFGVGLVCAWGPDSSCAHPGCSVWSWFLRAWLRAVLTLGSWAWSLGSTVMAVTLGKSLSLPEPLVPHSRKWPN